MPDKQRILRKERILDLPEAMRKIKNGGFSGS